MDATKDSTTAAPRPLPDPDRIAAFWAAHTRPGEVYEVRVPKPKRGGSRRFWGVVAGYFDDPAAVVRELGTITGDDAAGVYCSLGPVLPDLLARACNRLVPTDLATADDEVPYLRRLLVDVDARHPKGVCATEEERSAAIALAEAVRRFLREELDWPHPEKLLRTGNGAALHYLLPDLPNSPETVGLLAAGLSALSALFVPDPAAAPAVVDPTTFNPSRIGRVPGTVNALGDGTAARPWRLATARYNPAPAAVDVAHLEALAALAPVPEPGAAGGRGSRPGAPARTWDARDVLRESGVGFREKPYAGGTAFRLDRCLTSAEHADGAAVIELASGALAYRCHHASCRGKGWADARAALRIPRSLATVGPRSGRPALRAFDLRGGKAVPR